MTCRNAREYLFAFLDNELDAAMSIDLQRHLDGCPTCAREAEIERAVGKRLGHALEARPVPDFPRSLAGLTGPKRPPVSPGAVVPFRGIEHLNRVLGVAAAVALVAMAGAWFALSGQSEPGLAELLIGDFEHFVAEGAQVQLASADRAEVTAWLQDKTQLAVALPLPGDALCTLLGGRKCKIAGRPAAFAAYRMESEPASLVAVSARAVHLADMKEVQRDGKTHWLARRNGYTVLACRRGDLVYAAVSRLEERQLLYLMTGATHESD
ncbi:MAG: anti-sigma factor family protein [Phycisphaerae bacterium]